MTGSEVEVETTNGPKELSLEQRLFGDEGYRARLNIVAIVKSASGPENFPSVRLDPLTQAPFQGNAAGGSTGKTEGALFEVRAFYNCELEIRLSSIGVLRDDEEGLVECLRNDIAKNGLKLGYGTTKGFGWFNSAPSAPNFQFPLDGLTHTSRALMSGDKISEELKEQSPQPAVSLPWRTIEADLQNISHPVEEVASVGNDCELHSKSMERGISGSIDLSWVFDTPVLIGDGGEVRTPLKVGDHYVIPGSTIKGYVRSVLGSILNTRLNGVNTPAVGLDGFKKKHPTKRDANPAFPLKDALGDLISRGTEHRPNPHNPPRDFSFRPDFVETLFGHIQDLEVSDSLSHKQAHLKSRVSFGFADCVTKGRLGTEQETVLMGPDITSEFYDAIARKIYVPTKVSGNAPYSRLPPQPKNEGDPILSRLRFLEPNNLGLAAKDHQKLVFRGRIDVHNVSEVELGSIVWVLLTSADPKGRHLLGTGRAYGFGQCYCSDFNFDLRYNDGSPLGELPGNVADNYQARGSNIVPSFGAFQTMLNKVGRDPRTNHGAREASRRFDAVFGQHLRECAGLKADASGYQTMQVLKSKATPRTIREKHGGGDEAQGRLAALLAKAPS